MTHRSVFDTFRIAIVKRLVGDFTALAGAGVFRCCLWEEGPLPLLCHDLGCQEGRMKLLQRFWRTWVAFEDGLIHSITKFKAEIRITSKKDFETK